MSDAKPVSVTPTERPEITLKLSAPFINGTALTDEITLRSPAARAFLKYGAPYREYKRTKDGVEEVYQEFNFHAVFHIAADASGVPETLLHGIPSNDMYPLAYAVLDVIRPTKPTTINA